MWYDDFQLWPKSKRSRSKVKKVTLPFFSETIKATDINFGTIICCSKALQIMYCAVTFTQGQVHYVPIKGKKK